MGASLLTPTNVVKSGLCEMVRAGTKGLVSVDPILLVAALLGLVHSWAALGVLPVVLLAGVCFGALALVVTFGR